MTGSEVRGSHHLIAACRMQVPGVPGVRSLVVMWSGVGVDRAVMPWRLAATAHLVFFSDHAQDVRLGRIERLGHSLPVTADPTHVTSEISIGSLTCQYKLRQGRCTVAEKRGGVLWRVNIVLAVSRNVKGSAHARPDSDQPKYLITSRASPLSHAYHVWSTSVNAFVSYPAHRQYDRHTYIQYIQTDRQHRWHNSALAV